MQSCLLLGHTYTTIGPASVTSFHGGILNPYRPLANLLKRFQTPRPTTARTALISTILIHSSIIEAPIINRLTTTMLTYFSVCKQHLVKFRRNMWRKNIINSFQQTKVLLTILRHLI